MKTIYLELKMGAAGDMLCAALYELLDTESRAVFLRRMNGLGLPGVTVACEPAEKNGVTGTHYTVTVGGEEERQGEAAHGHGSGLRDILGLIESLSLPRPVIEHAAAVYRAIASAESRVHGEPVDFVHFHEVGAMDAVADVVGCCLLFEMLGADRVVASPVNIGSGFVRCAHGLLPVPAPATALLLCEMPGYSNGVEGELCTPTGAALVGHFAQQYAKMPAGTFVAVGYGMGKKNFAALNCVRAFLYEQAEAVDELVELRCNIDDMTPEAVAFLCEQLMDEGARDAYVQPVVMKKGRPGFVIVALCDAAQEKRLTALIFRHSSTLGVRVFGCRRHAMRRRSETVETEFGRVRVKRSAGFGAARAKAEYEDLAECARRADVPLETVRRAAEAAIAQLE